MSSCFRLQELCNKFYTEDYNTTMQGNYPGDNIKNDVANSYTVPGMNGPGNNPSYATGGNPSTGKAIDALPQLSDMSAFSVLQYLQSLIADELDEAQKQGEESLVTALKRTYNKLLDLELDDTKKED